MKRKVYGKMELAQLYNPNVNPQSARKTLWRWMHHHPTLMTALEQVGYNPARKSFLPRELDIIVDCLGEP